MMMQQPGRERIFLEHDARALADLAGSQRPACDGVMLRLGKADDVLACTVRSNVLGGQWLMDAHSPGDRVVSWSGTLAEGLFEAHPMTWLTPGHNALAAFCDEIQPQLEHHGKTLCFQPHARHVLNDPQSCARFLRERGDGPFEIALSPATMLEVSMLAQAEDHLTRAFETLGGLCAMVMLSDVVSDGEDVKCVPLGDGALPRDVVVRLLAEHVPQHVPIVLSAGRLDQQLAWLEAR